MGACARFSLSRFLFVHFVICFFRRSDVWHLEVAVLEDPSLRSLVPDLLDLQMGYRASSTVTKYKSGWLRWHAWASLASRLFLRNLCVLRFFITELTNNCLASNMGVSSVEAVVYGIKWAHSMAGLVSCPVSHPLVKSALEGAKRKLALPVRPKEPLSVDTVKAIANFYSSDVSLAVLR